MTLPNTEHSAHSSAHCVDVKKQNPVSWEHRGAREGQIGEDAHVGLVGMEELLLAADKDITKAARALESVCAGGKGKGQPVI